MNYLIKINKDIRDRIKIFEENDDNPIYIGKKEGAVSSFFDGFIGATYSKGAKFEIYEKGFNYLTIDRNFYDDIKKYNLFYIDEKIGDIKSVIRDEKIDFHINFYEENFDFSIDRSSKNILIKDIFEITPLKQRFTVYQELKIGILNNKYNKLAFALAIYIWDVFIKYKKAFINK